MADNDENADCDREAPDDPVELVDELEESGNLVEEEDDVQEIGEVSSEETNEVEDDLDASLASFKL